MNWVSSTKPADGSSVLSTGLACARVMKGARLARRRACRAIAAQEQTSSTASQKGKNPLWGPSVPQPMPRRRESQITRAPPAIRISAVVRSAVRMKALRLLLEEPALGHEIAVEHLGLPEPLDELGPRLPRRLQCALAQVVLELGRVVDLLQHALVPLEGVLGHVGRPEDAAQHEVGDVGPEGLLHGRDVLPLRD